MIRKIISHPPGADHPDPPQHIGLILSHSTPAAQPGKNCRGWGPVLPHPTATASYRPFFMIYFNRLWPLMDGTIFASSLPEDHVTGLSSAPQLRLAAGDKTQ